MEERKTDVGWALVNSVKDLRKCAQMEFIDSGKTKALFKLYHAFLS